MLALFELPVYLTTIYDQYKQMSRAIYNAIKDVGEKRRVQQGTNLLQLTDEFPFVFISEGMFKLMINRKTVRLYAMDPILRTVPISRISR